ncbi:MAG: AAA family ATPase [Planctomycetaceae bacterium]|nr:AAA family ATPase [Planctomycetaceae bacterium]
MDAEQKQPETVTPDERRALIEELQRRKLISEDQYTSLRAQFHWNRSSIPNPDVWQIPTFWEQETETTSPQRPAKCLTQEEITASPLDWLWPGHLACGKVSLLTGRSGDGKSLVMADLIARVTTGHNWPDGTPQNPARVMLLTPAHGLQDMVLPRLEAAGANLSSVQIVSTVTRLDTAGREYPNALSLPLDGPLLEKTLEKSENLRLLVIDSLSAFIDNSTTTSERESLLADLALLAETHNLSIVCVEGMRSNGLVPLPRHHEWRADYDRHFTAVWGVARDPRNRSGRLFLPIRHHLGNDRLGYRFEIATNSEGIANINWGEADDTITFAEATGRVRLGRSVWSFSQTAQAESWLRQYLAEGEKSSVDIMSDARVAGFTEFPVRDALRRIAIKSKQRVPGGWSWRLVENEQNSRVSS